MSESKFSDTLRRLRKTQESPSPSLSTKSPAGEDRPPTAHYRGKRSDPDWANVTLLMRRSVKRDVRRRLEDEGEGRDLSELIDRLLSDWLAEQGKPHEANE